MQQARLSSRNEQFRRIGVIGDIHAEHDRLEFVLGFLASQSLDGIFCVGDVVDGKGSANRCCRLLEEYGVFTVLGNHDEWCMEGSNRSVDDATLAEHLLPIARQFLESLPRIVVLETVCGKAMICHGLGENNMASVRASDSSDEIYNNLELWAIYRDSRFRFLFNGHTHHAGLRTFDHLTVFNVGSLNSNAKPCCGVVDFQNRTLDAFGVVDNGGSGRCMKSHFAGVCDPCGSKWSVTR